MSIGYATSGKVTAKLPLHTKLNELSNYFVEVKTPNPEFQSLVEPFKLSDGRHLQCTSRTSDETTQRALDSAGLYLAKYVAGEAK